ncbi:MAG: adenylate cyclase [Actinomycetes bacterium]
MTATKSAPGRYTDEQLSDLLVLLEDADSVELKLTVPDEGRRSAVAALDMDPLEAQLRQVFFFDTPDLQLNRHGVIPRARRVQGGGDDSVVKLRPVVPSELPADLRELPGFGVEVDASPVGFVCSGRLKAPLRTGRVKEAISGTRPTRSLFKKRQRAFFAEHAPAGIDLDDLSILGPITVLKLKFAPQDYGRRLVAELWNYPDGSRILELSTKCAPSEAMQVAAKTRVFLEGRGINLSGEQQTKTKTALEFFAKELQGS